MDNMMHATQTELLQLTDARYACQQAAAALLCVAAGAADPTLESEAKRLQCALCAAADELGAMIKALRVAP